MESFVAVGVERPPPTFLSDKNANKHPRPFMPQAILLNIADQAVLDELDCLHHTNLTVIVDTWFYFDTNIFKKFAYTLNTQSLKKDHLNSV